VGKGKSWHSGFSSMTERAMWSDCLVLLVSWGKPILLMIFLCRRRVVLHHHHHHHHHLASITLVTPPLPSSSLVSTFLAVST
jgi:hypothetical protein